MSSDTTGGFAEQLRQTQERYRRRDLAESLSALAVEMEETLLQRAFAAALFDAEFEIEPEAQAAVDDARGLLDEGSYASLDEKLDDVSTEVSAAKRRLENEVQPKRLDALNRVRAMQRLNERVERVDPERLAAIETLLDDWNWRANVEVGADDFEAALDDAATVGDEFRGHSQELQDELFGPYRGTEVWPVVQRLLDDERLTYGDLSAEERELLAESDLSAYVELSLS
ncbi:hypothetical protein [Halobaculum sp. MBLA0143]|uniref:hypothetical protein n=1 Tax=Halobaculum sp. MBLA0143 TaxID=3079933 RepID=UPI0035245318